MSQLWITQRAVAPSPSDVSAYLRQRGWTLGGTSERWVHYRSEVNGETLELDVPQVTSARDYAHAFGILLADLARLEDRTPSAVLRDIRETSLDIVRIAVESPMTRDGRIPVEAGRRVYEAARDMLLAAACAELNPRPVFPKRKVAEATSLLDRARFGHTELGSFVLTIECSVQPRLMKPLFNDAVDQGAPMERRACLKLAGALHGTADAARESAASAKLDPFRERTSVGVSANLCEALSTILDVTDADVVRAAFSFGSIRPLASAPPTPVAFTSDTAGVLREAAAALQEEATYAESELVGHVVRLESKDPAKGGEITLSAQFEGRHGAVKVLLPAESYAIAIDAHERVALVRCVGDVARDGLSWRLRGARDFAIANKPPVSG